MMMCIGLNVHVSNVCLQVSEGKLDNAKAIFYKALQNVPWSKVTHTHTHAHHTMLTDYRRSLHFQLSIFLCDY